MIFLVLLILSPLIFLFGDFSAILEKRLLIVLSIGACIVGISFLDDMETIGRSKFKIPPLFRLGMQILVGLIIGLTSIKISYVSNLLGGTAIPIDQLYWQFFAFDRVFTIHFFPVIVTVIWYVLIFNSVNFSDGLPGMTGGFALIAFCIIGML